MGLLILLQRCWLVRCQVKRGLVLPGCVLAKGKVWRYRSVACRTGESILVGFRILSKTKELRLLEFVVLLQVGGRLAYQVFYLQLIYLQLQEVWRVSIASHFFRAGSIIYWIAAELRMTGFNTAINNLFMLALLTGLSHLVGHSTVESAVSWHVRVADALLAVCARDSLILIWFRISSRCLCKAISG